MQGSKLSSLFLLLSLLECQGQGSHSASDGVPPVDRAGRGSEPAAGSGGGSVSANGGAGDGGENSGSASSGSASSGGFCGNGGPCVYYRENFDTDVCAPGWLLQGKWRCGEPEAIVQPRANSPAHVIASQGAGSDGPYLGVASSPPIDLSLAGQPMLEFYVSMKATRDVDLPNGHQYVSGLSVRARVGEELFDLPNVDPIYTGHQMWSESLPARFARHRIDLSAFSGKIINLDFEFDNQEESGDYVLIDDVSVYDASLVPATPESLAVPRCAPQTTRCAERLAQVCSMSGTWQTQQDCPYICTAGGSCGGSCRPYESSCDPAHSNRRFVCQGSGLSQARQTCLQECAAGVCRGVYLDEGFEGPTAPPRWFLTGDWAIANAPPLTWIFAPEDGSSLAARLEEAQTSREYAGDFAQSPEIDLTNATEPVLHFIAGTRTEAGKSGFDVWARSDGDGEFKLLIPEYPAYDGSVSGVANWSAYWLLERHFQVDLTQFAGHRISLRFALASDGTNGGSSEVYIDRATVEERAVVPLDIDTASPPKPFSAIKNEPFSTTLHAMGGSSRAIWSIVARTDADWLSIDPTTGTLSGVPGSSAANIALVTVRIEEPDVPANFAELEFEVDVL